MQKSARRRKDAVFIAATVLPALLLTIVFKLTPTFQVLRQSFYKVTSLGINPVFNGFNNYVKLASDKAFLAALGNTLKLILIVPVPTLLLALIFAFILTQTKLREKGIYRTVLFFPSALSMVVIGTVWANAIYHPNGMANVVLEMLGMEPKLWLVQSDTVLYSIAVVLIWQAVGYYMVMYIAGVDGISAEVFEASMIDGAGVLCRMFRIMMPMLWSVIRVTIVFALSGVLNLGFLIPKAMAIPAAPNDWNVLLGYMYSQAFEASNFGYAMAVSVVSLVLALSLSLLANRLQKDD